MKKHHQVSQKNNRPNTKGAQRKAPLRRYKIVLSPAEKEIIEAAAARRGLTTDEFAEKAIRKELKRARKKGRGVKLAGGSGDRAKIVVRPDHSDERLITTKAKSAAEIPGLIRLKDGKIKTGGVEWSGQEFDAALSARRFLVTTLLESHRFALASSGLAVDRLYEEFLTVIREAHLAELRDSIPLYWMEDPNSEGGVILVSLRGELPAGNDPAFGEHARKLLDEELRQRGIDAQLCKTLEAVDDLYQRGDPMMIRMYEIFLRGLMSELAEAKQQKGGAK